MSLERVTITIPSEILSAAKEAAEREGLSVSAWLSRAAERAARIVAGLAAAEAVLAELGPPTPEEQAWVDGFMAAGSDGRAATVAPHHQSLTDQESADLQERRRHERRTALDEMVQISEEAGLYDVTDVPPRRTR